MIIIYVEVDFKLGRQLESRMIGSQVEIEKAITLATQSKLLLLCELIPNPAGQIYPDGQVSSNIPKVVLCQLPLPFELFSAQGQVLADGSNSSSSSKSAEKGSSNSGNNNNNKCIRQSVCLFPMERWRAFEGLLPLLQWFSIG